MRYTREVKVEERGVFGSFDYTLSAQQVDDIITDHRDKLLIAFLRDDNYQSMRRISGNLGISEEYFKVFK